MSRTQILGAQKLRALHNGVWEEQDDTTPEVLPNLIAGALFRRAELPA